MYATLSLCEEVGGYRQFVQDRRQSNSLCMGKNNYVYFTHFCSGVIRLYGASNTLKFSYKLEYVILIYGIVIHSFKHVVRTCSLKTSISSNTRQTYYCIDVMKVF